MMLPYIEFSQQKQKNGLLRLVDKFNFQFELNFKLATQTV